MLEKKLATRSLVQLQFCFYKLSVHFPKPVVSYKGGRYTFSRKTQSLKANTQNSNPSIKPLFLIFL